MYVKVPYRTEGHTSVSAILAPLKNLKKMGSNEESYIVLFAALGNFTLATRQAFSVTEVV